MTTTTPDAASVIKDALAAFAVGGNPAPATTPAPTTQTATPAKPTKPLTFTRPNGETYYGRLLGKADDAPCDVHVVQRGRGATLAENLYVLLYGVPGTGKSAMVEAAFPNVITITGDLDTTTDDFLGSWVQNPDGTYAWIDGPLVTSMEQGRPLFIDEIALVNPSVLAIVYSAMDGRGEIRVKQNPARGVVKAADGFYVVGACNPDAPGARMSEALMSRFSLHIEATSDFDLCKKMGVPAKIITVARNLEEKRMQGHVAWSPQTRELLAFKRTTDRFGHDIAVANLIGIAPDGDRAIVADVVSRAFGAAVANLRQNGPATTTD